MTRSVAATVTRCWTSQHGAPHRQPWWAPRCTSTRRCGGASEAPGAAGTVVRRSAGSPGVVHLCGARCLLGHEARCTWFVDGVDRSASRAPRAGDHPAGGARQFRSVPPLLRRIGLARNGNLRGNVRVAFLIQADGTVADIQNNEGSTLPDAAVVECVSHGFGQLVFPAPQGGVVTVVYPIQFSPGD